MSRTRGEGTHCRAEIGFSLYLVTDEQTARAPERVARALAALPPGTAAVQLRAKAWNARALLHAAHSLREVTRAYGAALFVNERLDVALCAGADGVHLPLHGLPPHEVRRTAPALLVGASTHSLAEAHAAIGAEGGAHFVTFGPVWATPSKAGMGEPVGIEKLAEAARALPVPVFALGGVDAENALRCRAVGARVACLRGVLGADDPAGAARAFAGLAV